MRWPPRWVPASMSVVLCLAAVETRAESGVPFPSESGILARTLQAQEHEDCAKKWLTRGHVLSWPIPAPRLPGTHFDGRHFTLFVYRVSSTDRGLRVYRPRVSLFVTLDVPGRTECRPWSGLERTVSDRRFPMEMPEQEFQTARERLLRLTEAIARLYAARVSGPEEDVPPLSLEQARVIEDFGRLFLQMAEPAFYSAYRDANPEFWKWLRAVGGPSLPPPPRGDSRRFREEDAARLGEDTLRFEDACSIMPDCMTGP